MPSTSFIKSLNIEENVFELVEPTKLGCLFHYSAPYTGGEEPKFPAGLRFSPYGPMRDDALYMKLLNGDESLIEQIMNHERSTTHENLRKRLSGISFFITEEEIKTLNLKFLSGGRERLLQIFDMMREEDKRSYEVFLYKSNINALLIEYTWDAKREDAKIALLNEAKAGNLEIVLEQIDSSIRYAKDDNEKNDYRDLKEWLSIQIIDKSM